MGCGKLVPSDSSVAVQALFVKHDRECRGGCSRGRISGSRWSARPCGGRCVPPPASLGRPTWPRPRRSWNAFFALARSKLPFVVDQLLGLLLPDAEHLRGFFFEGHAREQIFDAARGGQARILIGGGRLGPGCWDGGLLFHADLVLWFWRVSGGSGGEALLPWPTKLRQSRPWGDG